MSAAPLLIGLIDLPHLPTQAFAKPAMPTATPILKPDSKSPLGNAVKRNIGTVCEVGYYDSPVRKSMENPWR